MAYTSACQVVQNLFENSLFYISVLFLKLFLIVPSHLIQYLEGVYLVSILAPYSWAKC